ncbi:MAG: hypothetical protein JWP35_859 [Caulobacter sp.]|nr:hypothetical protein [Caulobacter sp.]
MPESDQPPSGPQKQPPLASGEKLAKAPKKKTATEQRSSSVAKRRAKSAPIDNEPKTPGRGETAKPRQPEAANDAEWAMVRLTKAMVALTVATALCAIAAVVFAGLQWKEMHDSAGDAHRLSQATADFASAMKTEAENSGQLVVQAKNSADAAHSSAAATQAAGSAAQRNAAIQLRAYVGEDSAEITDFVVGKRPKFEIVLKNTGNTPAYRFGGWIGGSILPFPQRRDIAVGCMKPSERDVPPGGESHFIILLPELTEDTFNGVNSGKMAIYLFGRYSYRDAFNNITSLPIRLMYGGPNPTKDNGSVASYGFKLNEDSHC